VNVYSHGDNKRQLQIEISEDTLTRDTKFSGYMGKYDNKSLGLNINKLGREFYLEFEWENNGSIGTGNYNGCFIDNVYVQYLKK